jgi:hypothetical protein
MELYNTWKITPKLTQWPDADVTIPAYTHLGDIAVQYQHVKSHSSNGMSTSFPTKIHNLADKLAREYCSTMRSPRQNITNKFCLLCIGDRFVTRDIQKIIIETASKIPIAQFLHDKFEWKSRTFELINWELQYKILSTYEIQDQQRILKFVHNWLPTNHRLQREAQSTTS